MTLEEAIATYEQYVLEAKKEKLSETYKYYTQLTNWLRELQERRKADNETKRGNARWLINSDGYYPYCSACMAEPKNGIMTDYCPNCGADMRGE